MNTSIPGRRRGPRRVPRLFTLDSQLSTLNSSSGTVLVLVVALLALLALLAATFLVTTRFNQVSTQAAAVSHQMEMLLSMLEGDISRKLAEDLWGDNASCNGPGDPAREGYDAPDASHPWLRGVCGSQIVWEPAAGDPAYTQPVVASEADWRALAGTQDDGLTFRYAVLIQDLGGLLNVNVARQIDPDLAGSACAVSPDPDHPEQWPYTIWAFHAARGNADWGYWWWTAKKRYNSTSSDAAFGACGRALRGGGPAQQTDLRGLLADPGELGRLDAYLRDPEDLGREFDIQDELDLRFPGPACEGAPYASRLEAAVPSLFSTATPGGIPAGRRRLVTAIGRTTGWVRRREPIYMHPYPEAFWSQAGLDKSLCDEAWFFGFDGPHTDDLIKYQAEARMGYRIPLQRGVTLSKMAPDDPFNIYARMDPVFIYPGNLEPLSPVDDVPDKAPPQMYDEQLVQHAMRETSPPANGQYLHVVSPNLAALLLANAMAAAGVPAPGKDPDQAASYAPQPYAHLPAAKSARAKAYRDLVAAFHLNGEDWQDPNSVPGMLPGWEYDTYTKTWRYMRYHNYGDWAGAEDRPYISEVVLEFEPWPDYCILREYSSTLVADRVDKGSSAEARGLRENDAVTAVRVPPATAWTTVATLSDTAANGLRTALTPVRPGGTVDLRVSRPGTGTVELTAVPIEPAVRSIAVEVYNPHDHTILMNDHSFSGGAAKFRYNVCVPQQCDAAGKRALLSRSPLNFASADSLPARSCMLYIESRGVAWNSMAAWMSGRGIGGVPYYPTNKPSTSSANAVKGEESNLVNLRPADGEILLTINRCGTGYRGFGYLADAVRNQPAFAAAAPAPATGASPGAPAGIAAAFAEARAKMAAAGPYPVVRLYRPRYAESRATQYIGLAWDSWAASSGGRTPAGRLGRRGADEDDFTHPDNDDYRNIDARGLPVATANVAFRFGADASRVTRLLQPRLNNTFGDRSDPENLWLDHARFDGQPAEAPTEAIDRQMRAMLEKINTLGGGHGLASGDVRQIIQKCEARLRFSPYTPATEAEKAECAAWYDFIDSFTVGGAAYDNIDNNGNACADEHGDHDFDLGMPPELEDSDPGGRWLPEHSNCWPAYGRINVNTAPLEVLQHALVGPSDAVRQDLAAAIYAERGGQASPSNAGYRPFTTLGDLYARVSVLNGHGGGFDRFGFDGADNHNGAAKLPDMPPDPYGYVDDLDERNYLWRVNSEIVTLRSDTFAVYLRFQARREVGGQQKVVAERRVYEIWDRADCFWPIKGPDGRLHPDHAPPQRIGIQTFGY